MKLLVTLSLSEIDVERLIDALGEVIPTHRYSEARRLGALRRELEEALKLARRRLEPVFVVKGQV